MHHSSEWLEGDFEPPTTMAKKDYLVAWRVHRCPNDRMVAMKLDRGTAVWNVRGQLLHYFDNGADIGFASDAEGSVLSLENRFGRSKRGVGVMHVLRRLEASSWRTLAEAEVEVPLGGAEYLVVDHRGTTALATWRDQTEWGYLHLDLESLAPILSSLDWPTATLSPPQFGVGDEIVIACHYHANKWWTDDVDDWYSPSPGGARKVGTITVHRLATNAVSKHDIFVELPSGWLPDRPEEVEWNAVWGPEVMSNERFRVWLPDGSEEILKLPLPASITIKRPLKTVRDWPD